MTQEHQRLRWSYSIPLPTATPNVAPETPVQIFGASLLAWYKADVGVYNDAGVTPASNGQTVQQWNDQTPHGYNLLQSNSSSRPTFGSTTYNGHPGVTFTRSSGTRMFTASDAVAFNQTVMTYFAVVKPTLTVAEDLRITSLKPSSAGNDFDVPSIALFTRGQSSDVYSYASNFLGNSTTAVSYPNDTTKSWMLVLDGANANVYLQNVVQGNATAFSATLGSSEHGSTIRFGSGFAAGSDGAFFQGVIAEIGLVDRAASSDERARLQDYLASRWTL